MDILANARAIRSQLDNVTSKMTDEQALQSPALFREWGGNGITYESGQRVVYNDILYKVLQNHTSQADWMPETAVSLFTKVLIPDENTIPEWEQPDSTNGYMIGDKILYNGKTYESVIDNNVWSPADYPAGWKEI